MIAGPLIIIINCNICTLYTHIETRRCREQKLNEIDDDGGISTVDAATGRLENAHRVVDDGVDTCKLLEKHNPHRNTERF